MSNKHDLPPLLSPAERGFIIGDLNRNLTGFKGWSWDDVVQATELVVRAQFANHIQRLEAENEARQAKIDALMLEFCPAEMSREQVIRWAQHQVASPDFDEAALDAAMTKEQKT